ncbi:MAG: hypothetical protein DMG68_03300 [Acidobacteria bacterium]|nr:MAG: hypothetical protein DMG68_03300 [Acidobacteriota bacterium]
MGFYEAAIPSGRLGSGRERRSICRRTRTEEFVVPAMLVEQREIKLLHVEQAEDAFPMERLVASGTATDGNTA